MKQTICIIALLVLPSLARAQLVDWTVDPAHTSVAFVVRHLGITKVHGTIGGLEAKVKADKATGHLSELEATLKTATVNTGIAKRDDHLRTDDFFNVTKYPTMKIVVKSVQWKGENFTIVADVTIRDVTKPVTFTGECEGVQKVTFGDGDQLRAGYSAIGKINRKDFNLKFNALAEGAAVVGDEVTIEIDAEIALKL